MRFDVDVFEADEQQVTFAARGPIDLAVAYALKPDGRAAPFTRRSASSADPG